MVTIKNFSLFGTIRTVEDRFRERFNVFPVDKKFILEKRGNLRRISMGGSFMS